MQVLCIRGFLAARKHADRILLLVEMLGTSGFPCFKAGIKTVYALRRRFALQATEPQVLQQHAGTISWCCCPLSHAACIITQASDLLQGNTMLDG